jgi:hypothetical protein
MGFSGAGAPDKDCIALGVEEGSGGEFANLPFIDRSVGEDELVEILEDRELGPADAVADRAGLPMGAFGPDQTGDERIISSRRARPLPATSSKLARMP